MSIFIQIYKFYFEGPKLPTPALPLLTRFKRCTAGFPARGLHESEEIDGFGCILIIFSETWSIVWYPANIFVLFPFLNHSRGECVGKAEYSDYRRTAVQYIDWNALVVPRYGLFVRIWHDPKPE